MCVAVVIAVNDIADTEFLINPVGVGCRSIVGDLHVLAVCVVHVVGSGVEVVDHVLVMADIVAHVDTAGKVELVGDELVLVGGDETVPFVAVDALCHHHHRACLGSGVDVLDGAIVECSVGTAEVGRDGTVICAAPFVAPFACAALASVTAA